MQEEKIIDIVGVSYAFCDTIDDFLSQCENDDAAMKEIKKDKDLIFFAKEIKRYFNDDFKEMLSVFRLNLGVAAYNKKDYEGALEYFTLAEESTSESVLLALFLETYSYSSLIAWFLNISFVSVKSTSSELNAEYAQ